MNIVTRIIDGRANKIWMPRLEKKSANHPLRPNRMTAARPTVTGDSANGRSTNAFISARPANRCRTSTHATTTPITAVTTTVTTAMMPVSRKACCTSGSRNVSATTCQPGSSAVHAMLSSGSSSSAPTYRTTTAISPPRTSRLRRRSVRAAGAAGAVPIALIRSPPLAAA